MFDQHEDAKHAKLKWVSERTMGESRTWKRGSREAFPVVSSEQSVGRGAAPRVALVPGDGSEWLGSCTIPQLRPQGLGDTLEFLFFFFLSSFSSSFIGDGHKGTIDTAAPRLRREGSKL